MGTANSQAIIHQCSHRGTHLEKQADHVLVDALEAFTREGRLGALATRFGRGDGLTYTTRGFCEFVQTAQFLVRHETLEALRVLVIVLGHDRDTSLLVPMNADGSRKEVFHQFTLTDLFDVDTAVAHLRSLTVGYKLLEAFDAGIHNGLCFQFDVAIHGLPSRSLHIDVDRIALNVVHAIVRDEVLLHELLHFGDGEIEGDLTVDRSAAHTTKTQN